MGDEFRAYIKQITQNLPTGNTFTCLQALKHLLEQTDGSLRVNAHFEQPDMPDLVIYRDGIATGYVFIGDETIGLADEALSNVLYTDYLAFHHHGQTARLGTLTDSQITPVPHLESVTKMLAAFINAPPESVHTAEKLAQRLGEITALVREGLVVCLEDSTRRADEYLMAQWRVWQQATDWTPAQFADEYAQAIAFSLVSARLRHDGPARQGVFTLRDTTWDLPPTNPFMRDLIRHLDDDRVMWRIDAIVALLARANIAAIRADIDRRVRAQDPLGPLYQAFTRQYQPRSVITQTPESLAIYLTESVHHLLRKRFKRTFGLADDQVQIIDPAATDGTALFFIIQRISTVLRRGQQLDGAWNAYAAESLLPRLYGFSQSLAAYALIHLKIGLQLDTIGYHFDNDQRLQVYLSGDPADVAADSSAQRIRDELRHAPPAQTPLTAILSDALDGEMHLPAARQTIEATQGGVVGMALPKDFADGVRHAVLRDDLLHFYSDLYILQLPEMTVGLFARRVGWQTGAIGRVRFAAAPSLDWLATQTITSTHWLEIQPSEPDYRFLPTVDHPLHQMRDADSGWRLDAIMPEHSAGLSVDHVSTEASPGSVPVLYHPFDLRYVANSPIIGSLRHMLRGDNLALCVLGSTVFCTSAIPHENALGSSTQIFPLYVYPDTTRLVADSPFAPGMGGRRPNFETQFILYLANRLDLIFLPDGRGDLHETFGPEDIFNSLYALLNGANHDPQHLRFPKEARHFRYLARRGHDLARYHRLHRPHNWSLITGYHGNGSNRLETGYPRYIELAGEAGGRAYINKDKFFTGIDRHLWKMQIGEIQVLYRWLANREGHVLGWADILHFQRMVVALTRSAITLDKINKRLRDA